MNAADRHLVDWRAGVAVQGAARAELRVAPLEPTRFPQRRLLIDGAPIFELTVPCDTCEFFFERLGAAPGLRASAAESLATGISTTADPTVAALEVMLATGLYDVLLLDVCPTLVVPGDAGDYFTHEAVEVWPSDDPPMSDPGTPYWRTLELQIDHDTRFFELVVPVASLDTLDEERIAAYEQALRSGDHPTAVSISVLDAREPPVPASLPHPGAHWCLAHFLLDGHHKAVAAARTGLPLRILSFLARSSSIVSDSERADCLARLAASPIGSSSVAH